ncbi:MAG: glycosyltransferase [Chitinophagaceae bacterium]
MKILHIAGKMDPRLGGVAQAVRTIIRGLEAFGLYNEVATLDDPKASFLEEEGLVLHTPGMGRGPWYYNAKFIPWLNDNLTRFDIIIVHGLWQFHGYAVQKIFRLLKKTGKNKLPALFIMPHGMLDPYFQEVPGRKLKALRNWSYWKFIENKIINGADGILFTCLEEQRQARLPFRPYYPKREAIAGLGVQDPPLYSESMKKAFIQKCPSVENRPYLLFLGRIDKKKGVDLLIEAYRSQVLDRAGKEKQLPILVIAGPGMDTPYGEKIRRMVASSTLLLTSVAFTGMLTGDAKWGAFYCAEAFVLPSHQENFGIALVEAMACGKPALISNKVNIWQEVIKAQGGLVEDDTAAGTSLLLNSWDKLSPDERRLMGVRARQCFEKQFSVEMAARQMLEAMAIDQPALCKNI